MIAALLVPLFFLAGPIVDADPEAEYQRGKALYLRRKFGECAEAFERAHALRVDPRYSYKAAQCRWRTGDYRRAILLYHGHAGLRHRCGPELLGIGMMTACPTGLMCADLNMMNGNDLCSN
jgi:hypothetical protein